MISLIAGAIPAMGQYTTPHIVETSEPAVCRLNGTKIVNYGLVGVGRLPAAMVDAQGSTFGSASALAIEPGTWKYDAKRGRYEGTLITLPDRGRNDPEARLYINYQNRLQKLRFTFVPLAEGEKDGSSQDQLKLTYDGLVMLKERDGKPLVGNDPGAGGGRAFDRPVPRNKENGSITLDAEGLVVMPDGGFYVSDEYAAAIYTFDADGVLSGVINPPRALMPLDDSEERDFNSVTAPATGRRNNRGMEGLSLTPGGQYLIAMPQGGSVQDSEDDDHERFTRVLRYDISEDATPKSPSGHYVFELPTFRSKGDGKPPNKTAAQSEILAISDTQFLVLARDGYGRGDGSGKPMMYKCILLADLAHATNLVGTEFEGLASVAPEGRCDERITTVAHTEAVNMLNRADLRRFGLNLDVTEGTEGNIHTLSEKWEGLCLLPDLATEDPTDYFLLVANDNDFITTDGVMKTVDGQTMRYQSEIDCDTVVLVYRLKIEGVGSRE